MDKLRKKVQITEYDIYDLEGNFNILEDMVKEIKEIEKDYENIHTSISLEDDGDGPYGYIKIFGYRLETDEELNTRMEHEARIALNKHLEEQKKLEDEKKLYIKLKEKFSSII